GWAVSGTADPGTTCGGTPAVLWGDAARPPAGSSVSTGTSRFGRVRRTVPARPVPPRSAPKQHPVHQVGEGLIGLHAPRPDLAQALRRDRPGRPADDPREVDAVHDVLGEADEVHAPD